MAIVKADAYGHGVGPVARALLPLAAAFGVAGVAEAQGLARALPGSDPGHPAREILVLGPLYPDEKPALVEGGFSASLSSVAEVRELAALARTAGRRVPVHAVADTGMGRIGALGEDFVALVEAIRSEPSLRLAGVDSHFSSADEDAVATSRQIADFDALLGRLRSRGWLERGVAPHLANSAGLLGRQGEMPWSRLVRAGLALYGVSPLPEHQASLRPAMAVKTRVSLVRDLPAGWPVSYGRTFVTPCAMRTATLGIGYADGYPRALSGSGVAVLVRGQRCPLLGRVTMDQIVVDVSPLGDTVRAGDEAVVLGSQGGDAVPAGELARLSGTIPWEILTGFSARVRRLPVWL